MRFQFDDFTLDTQRFELARAGTVIHAEPQVIELLALLVENSQRLVSKDEINHKVWRGRVVSEAALSSRIKMARQLLDDDGSLQRYIRTIHKRGFRFVGEARVIEAELPARLAPADALARASIDGRRRPETLGIAELARLADVYATVSPAPGP